MTILPDRQASKRALKSHGWLGVALGAMLYLICLSGTILVVGHELARWEQPVVPDGRAISSASVQQAYRHYLNEYTPMGDVLIMLPGAERHAGYIDDYQDARYLLKDGTLGDAVSHPVLDMITDLHLYFHLPPRAGLIVVGLLGVALTGLIVSGFIALRRIKKDLFAARLNQSAQRKHSDLHNRLSVWLSPFHLLFGITGAFFGLASLFTLAYASLYYDGDTQAVIDEVYDAQPEFNASGEIANVARALEHFAQYRPDETPVYLAVENAGTDKQFLILGASQPQRLIYVEQYRYDEQGEYISHAGFGDGEAGRQIIFSVYRLHFGEFAGFASKLLYLLAGISLTIVCASGISLWLQKRPHRDYLNSLWGVVVWGAPLSFVTAAVLGLAGVSGLTAAYWAALGILAIVGLMRPSWVVTPKLLITLFSFALAMLIMTHTATFGLCAWAGGAGVVNGLLFILFWVMTFKAIRLWFYTPHQVTP